MMVPTMTKRPAARERLLDTASRLFYAEGVQSVGIDRILDESGVAKGSLYKNFGSKDGLVAAYLDNRRERQVARISEALSATDDPREKVLAIFDIQARLFAEPGYRGCAFVAANSEAPVGGTIDIATSSYRDWTRELFSGLAEELGAADPARLGRQLHLLYDGATLSIRMDRDPSVAADAKAAAELLLDVVLAV